MQATSSIDESPESSPAGMTPEQLAEARQYGRYSLACTLADKLLDVLYLAVATFVLAKPLDAWLKAWPPMARWASLRLIALYLSITLLHMAVSLPLVFYAGHVLEHRFHLSNLGIGGWTMRYLKRNALTMAFGAVLMLGLYWLIWTTGPWWWLAAAAAFFCVTIILGRIFPLVIIPLFYKIERLNAPELAERMNELAAGTGLDIEGVYRIVLSQETVKANAMLAGVGRSRRVLLGDTLLSHFTPDEIAVVFAHEIGHHVFRHVRKMLVLGIFVSTIGFWICDRLLTALVAGGGGRLDYATLPVWTLPGILLILTVFGMMLEPLMNAISRRHERQCDRYALERTRQPAAYVSAFRKLAQQNKDDPSPHWLEVVWLHDHPPIAERLAMGKGLGR
jgi:STE24 endopeptidase